MTGRLRYIDDRLLRPRVTIWTPYGRPFRILIRMLGSPPLGIGVERAVQDTLLRLSANRF